MAIGFVQADRRKVSCRNLRETGTGGQKAGQGERGAMVQFSGVPKGWEVFLGGGGALWWSCCMHVCLCVTGEGLKERSNLWFERE